ncbi:RagB/SusD family nutrient uptake outer membrane protein [Pedobacter sp. GR22-6]|uniref:RagB/SusD family nutrient uptake outer membrane protein n=1 Tax=Pedobacter sp. GR22-6 TaxID=3127957 RepID=UPI00307ED3C7
MKRTYSIQHPFLALTLLLGLCLTSGCKNFLEIPLPTDKLAADGAYLTDNSAGAVITGILSSAAANSAYGGSLNNESIGYRTSLYVDDFQLINPNSTSNTAYLTSAVYHTNTLTSAYSTQWSILYKQLYYTNLAIEGIKANESKLPNKNQWLGEALFIRALSHFDLLNLYGDVPLATTSNYLVNNVSTRSPKAAVVNQMIEDLKQAEALLGTTYLNGLSVLTPNRARPNQYVAAALLARVYLYNGDWANAETEATKVIGNTTAYELVAPAAAFLANSRETIFALAPMANTGATFVRDYGLYNGGMPAVAPSQANMASFSMTPISESLKNSFETGDARFSNWLRLTTTTASPVGGQFYFPAKYKSNVVGAEFNILLRLAEQYLIRAEARARLNKLTEAKQDIDAVRARASLGGTPASLQPDLINAVMKERRVELFAEFGHRFYDLKRTGTIDVVMNIAAPLKGGTWASWKQIWPIPATDIIANPNLTQAPEYN